MLFRSEYSLKEILDRKNFKTYDELKARLDRVLGVSSPNVSRGNTFEAVKAQRIENEEKKIDVPFDTNGESDDDLDYFSKLLEDE